MNTDLERAAEALRLGRLDEAELHAWNALLTVGSDDIVRRGEFDQWSTTLTIPIRKDT